MLKRVIFLFTVSFAVSLFSGCSPHSSKIHVRADKQITEDNSFEVHVFGVNPTEKKRVLNMSMTEYWQPGSQMMRAYENRRVVLYFGKEEQRSFVISKNNFEKQWQEWQRINASDIVILADMPINPESPFQDNYGSEDIRRLCAPFKPQCWEFGRVEIEISSGSGIIATNFKPEGGMFCDCEIE
ncbi:hypothetical protein [Sedimentisphaera salicampi]|uniref:Lipoprotein n=1 Tax=Sedimentisphaera salicampi TaxID=1941349 RepID=A0A1W6LMD8_9BACT|nr:hypothetical protein [Sedimentisphaera salicampi]ARN56912.1 hypothetical protein STSP1_01305 [Sedimentisphaera salicampi]